jgi:hypothetical protein
MKKSRLLEIIREEISSALDETLYSGPNSLKEPLVQKALSKMQGQERADAIKGITTGTNPMNLEEKDLEEDQLNEVPDFGGRFDKQVAAKYGEEDTLEAATEKITNRVLSDKGISKADVAKMDKDALKALLKDIRAFISQKNRTPEVAAALKKQTEFDDSGSNLQDNQTNKAILRALGFESKKGPKGPTKPKAEKAPKAKAEKATKEKVATRTAGDDGFDKVEYSDDEETVAATKAAGSDETAKELGDVSSRKDKVVKAYQKLQPQVKDEIAKAKAGDKAAEEWLRNTWTPILKAYNKAKEVNI